MRWETIFIMKVLAWSNVITLRIASTCKVDLNPLFKKPVFGASGWFCYKGFASNSPGGDPTEVEKPPVGKRNVFNNYLASKLLQPDLWYSATIQALWRWSWNGAPAVAAPSALPPIVWFYGFDMQGNGGYRRIWMRCAAHRTWCIHKRPDHRL